jgi:hypothetical protein
MIGAARAVLEQGIGMLASLDAECYARVLPLANGASIGGHYRHSLEHFRQLLCGLPQCYVDYDGRNRDALLETDPKEALRATRELIDALGMLSPSDSNKPLDISSGISYGENECGTATSTIGREIIFCTAHAIHHYALIAMILRSEGHVIPPDFGVAPSTLRHRNSSAPIR